MTKTLIDLASLRTDLRKNLKTVEDEKGSINPGNPVVERLSGMSSAYEITLKYLKKCSKFDYQGNKILYL